MHSSCSIKYGRNARFLLQWEPQYSLPWWNLLSQGEEHNLTTQQWKGRRYLSHRCVSSVSVELICAKGEISTNRRSASHFSYLYFSFHSPSWSRESLAVKLSYASWANFINSIKPVSQQWQSCTRIWPSKVKLVTCQNRFLVGYRFLTCNYLRIHFPFVYLAFFYRVFRDPLFFISCSFWTVLKQCSSNVPT